MNNNNKNGELQYFATKKIGENTRMKPTVTRKHY